MKYIYILIIVMLFLFPRIGESAQFSTDQSLYTDDKATKVGDIVTIYIIEQASAENRSGNTANSNANVSLSLNAETGTNNVSGLSTKGNFGYGTDRNKNNFTHENLSTKISAQIVAADSVGNYVLRGQRTVITNGNEQTTTLTGMVRPSDIQPNNIVYSYNIYNTKITYIGNQNITQKPNFFSKLLDWIF